MNFYIVFGVTYLKKCVGTCMMEVYLLKRILIIHRYTNHMSILESSHKVSIQKDSYIHVLHNWILK